MNNTLTWTAVLVRFSVPFLVTTAEGLALRRSQAFVGTGAASLGALLLIWPAFLDPRLIPYTVQQRKVALYIVYAMFIASFALIGLAGGQVARFAQEPLENLFTGESARNVLEAARSGLGTLVWGLLAIAIAGIAVRVWRSLYARIQRR